MPKQTARAALSSDWFERAVRFGDAALIFMAAGLVAVGRHSLLLAVHRQNPDPGEAAPEDRLP